MSMLRSAPDDATSMVPSDAVPHSLTHSTSFALIDFQNWCALQRHNSRLVYIDHLPVTMMHSSASQSFLARSDSLQSELERNAIRLEKLQHERFELQQALSSVRASHHRSQRIRHTLDQRRHAAHLHDSAVRTFSPHGADAMNPRSDARSTQALQVIGHSTVQSRLSAWQQSRLFSETDSSDRQRPQSASSGLRSTAQRAGMRLNLPLTSYTQQHPSAQSLSARTHALEAERLAQELNARLELNARQHDLAQKEMQASQSGNDRLNDSSDFSVHSSKPLYNTAALSIDASFPSVTAQALSPHVTESRSVDPLIEQMAGDQRVQSPVSEVQSVSAVSPKYRPSTGHSLQNSIDASSVDPLIAESERLIKQSQAYERLARQSISKRVQDQEEVKSPDAVSPSQISIEQSEDMLSPLPSESHFQQQRPMRQVEPVYDEPDYDEQDEFDQTEDSSFDVQQPLDSTEYYDDESFAIDAPAARSHAHDYSDVEASELLESEAQWRHAQMRLDARSPIHRALSPSPESAHGHVEYQPYRSVYEAAMDRLVQRDANDVEEYEEQRRYNQRMFDRSMAEANRARQHRNNSMRPAAYARPY